MQRTAPAQDQAPHSVADTGRHVLGTSEDAAPEEPGPQDEAPASETDAAGPPVCMLEIAAPEPTEPPPVDDVDGTRSSAAMGVSRKLLISFLVFLLVVVLLEKFAAPEVTQLSKKFLDFVGLPGLFILILILDGIPQPFTYAPLIFMAVKGGDVPKEVIFLVCAAGSYCAVLAGYAIGTVLRATSHADEFVRWLEHAHPSVPDLMKRRGALGVVIAAFLPVPLAAASWAAGAFRTNLLMMLVVAVARAPKIGLYVLLSPGPTTDAAPSSVGTSTGAAMTLSM